MSKRLGLNVGPNGIGWCVLEGEKVLGIGVRAFGDSREPSRLPIAASGEPLAVQRRLARGARRRRDRYLGRRKAMLRALQKHNLMPHDEKLARKLAIEDPYELRVRALSKKISPFQIGRILFHLNQRRGFKSNRNDARAGIDNAEVGAISCGIAKLDAEMRRMNARTYGEFLFKRSAESDAAVGKRIRISPDAISFDFYPDRRHILDEFRAIWSAQKFYHNDLLSEHAWEDIFRVIEFQRPLKSSSGGFCTFAGIGDVPPDETRLSKAHPLYQKFRLYQDLNKLTIVSAGNRSRMLSIAERDKLYIKMQSAKRVKFTSLRKEINLKNGEYFESEEKQSGHMAGDVIFAEFAHKKLFGSRWEALGYREQWLIIQRIIDGGSINSLATWFEHRYNLDKGAALAVASAKLPVGFGRFGLSATEALLKELRSDVCTYDIAVSRSQFAEGGEVGDVSSGRSELPYYGKILAREIAPGRDEYGDVDERRYGKVSNPSLHVCLRQVAKIVNAAIREFGKPESIHVEVAKELKLNEKKKVSLNSKIRINRTFAASLKLDMASLNMEGGSEQKFQMRLWSSLPKNIHGDGVCIYCGVGISISDIIENNTNVDYIIPFHRCLDDGTANKILSHRSCFEEKAGNTPWEKWGGEPERWAQIQERVGLLPRSTQWRFAPDAWRRFQSDAGGLLPSRFIDNQYVSNLIVRYLNYLFGGSQNQNVFAVKGAMVAMLRRLWGFNELLEDRKWVYNKNSAAPKNRPDHRHRAINAAVAAIISPHLIEEIVQATSRAAMVKPALLIQNLPLPWASQGGASGFHEELAAKLAGVVVSHKAEHGGGGLKSPGRGHTSRKLHKDTAYGLTKDISESGAPVVVHRIPFLSLRPEDLANPDCIADSALRQAILQATQDCEVSNFAEALRNFSRENIIFKGIRRLRIRSNRNVIPIADRDGRAYKGFLGAANEVFSIWRLPDGVWTTHWVDGNGQSHSSIVSSFDFHQRGFCEKRPHPAAKKVMTLRQNDMVAIEQNGARQIYRVQKFGKNGQISLVDHAQDGKLTDRSKDGTDPFKFWNPSVGVLQKLRARQVRVDELGRVFDPGPNIC